MEFIESNLGLNFILAGAGIALSLIVCIIGIIIGDKDDKVGGEKLQKILTSICVFGMVAFVIFIILGIVGHHQTNDEVKSQIEETYGLTLTGDEFKNLRYPISQPPVNDVVEYGRINDSFINDDGELAKTSITLAWTGDEFKLFESTDDEVLGAELPRVEQ